MTTIAAGPAAAAPSFRNRADVSIARRAFRQVRTGAIITAVVFGGTAASSALAYVQTFPDEAARQQVAASTASDIGLRVLLGPVDGIGTVGGYTFYKTYVFLTTIGAVWAVLSQPAPVSPTADSAAARYGPTTSVRVIRFLPCFPSTRAPSRA